MRIAYVCLDPGIPVFGTKGACVHIQEVVRELRRLGHQVTVYAARRGKVVPPDLRDLEVVKLGIHGKETARREDGQSKVAKKLAKHLVDGQPDLIYERYSLFSTVIARVNSKIRIPAVLEVNSPLIAEQAKHRELVNEQAAWDALRAQAGAARAVICVSAPVRDWVCRHTGATRVHVVPNGVNTRRITPVIPDPNRAIVVFVGTLKPWHGVGDLLLAAHFAQQDWTVRIIGDGPERENLERKAHILGINVDFRGAVSPRDIPHHLAGSRIAVAPYPDVCSAEDHYFSPLKVYEYLAAGLPVVASDVGELPEVLAKVGVIVPPSDPLTLAPAIDDLVSDPQRCARMGAAARDLAVNRHSWSVRVDQILHAVGVDHER